MIKKAYISILLWIPLAYACQLDPLPGDELTSFNKLYAVSENVEAIDFICKPDQSGYIILGNFKSSENSDIFLIDVAPDGMQRRLNRVNTQFFDEAVKLKIDPADNSLIVLGHRRTEAAQANVYQNILLKANIDGVPVKAENASEQDSVSAEIKIITNNQNTPYQLNDFIIIPPHLITVGTIRQSPTGNFNKITRIYDWNTFNFSDTSDVEILMTREKPVQIRYQNNSRNLKVLAGNSSDAIYAVYGTKNTENTNGEISGKSDNISWNIYTNIESTASEPLDIGTDLNEEFGNVLHHTNGTTYIAGNYRTELKDSLFLITKEYKGKNKNLNQKIYSFDSLGTKASSLAEDIDGNIIMATIEEGTLNNTSYLLKFSPFGEPIEVMNENQKLEIQQIQFPSTGFYDIKKIESEANNIVVILSQKRFENNSTAIGLMKIKF